MVFWGFFSNPFFLTSNDQTNKQTNKQTHAYFLCFILLGRTGSLDVVCLRGRHGSPDGVNSSPGCFSTSPDLTSTAKKYSLCPPLCRGLVIPETCDKCWWHFMGQQEGKPGEVSLDDMGAYQGIHKTRCHHLFHQRCISLWLQRGDICCAAMMSELIPESFVCIVLLFFESSDPQTITPSSS